MLYNCIFHEPVIPCTAFGIVSDIECLHTTMFTLGSVVQSFYKNLHFPKKCEIFHFGWFFAALQFCKRTEGLYKMNNNSI